jgi:Cysteine rich repeat
MEGASMLRATMLATAITFIILSPVSAQEITAAERTACKTDYEKYCRGTFPGGGRIIACLSKHYADLGDSCKKIVDANKK